MDVKSIKLSMKRWFWDRLHDYDPSQMALNNRCRTLLLNFKLKTNHLFLDKEKKPWPFRVSCLNIHVTYVVIFPCCFFSSFFLFILDRIEELRVCSPSGLFVTIFIKMVLTVLPRLIFLFVCFIRFIVCSEGLYNNVARVMNFVLKT